MPLDFLDVADWRRRIAELYAAIRAADDPAAAWEDWRAGRDRLIRDHPASPVETADRAGFRGLAHFDYDPAWRLTVGLGERATLDPPIDIPAGDDGIVGLTAAARTDGLAPRLGQELTVYWIGGYGGGMFLPFKDATAGRETYGGGRYLLDSIKGADLGQAGGRLVLDFNFAYHPSCCYSPIWVCPLAPRENLVAARVTAGERLPSGA